jgi:hypothetical protein
MAQAKECSQTEQRAKTLGNRYWRLNNLYWIMNEQGEKIKFTFKARPVLELLYFNLWWLNIIPKSRQHGITTFIALLELDTSLFNSNVRCGIIAHKLNDAKKIFRDKIKFAYDHLPHDLKKARTSVKDDTEEIMFNNNSGIYVGTSMRSGTLQILHVSEYAWICTHAPQKAAEIKSGAMETVHKEGMIFVESTFEGPIGDFPIMCSDAEKVRASGRELGRLDYRIHFFAWWQKPENVTDPKFVQISPEQHKYYDKLEKIFKKPFTLPQRAWHFAKKRTLKHLMTKEHPSTFEEASIASVEGSYHAEYMAEMREAHRICRVPHLPAYPVFTVNDLGIGGHMPWIFFQMVGLECHIIDCFALSDKDDTLGGAPYFKRMLDGRREEFGYSYGKYFCPFDVNKGEIGLGQTIYDTFKQHGIVFEVLPLESNVIDGIQRLQKYFPIIYIDAEKCQPLITAWSCYHREWIENLSRYDVRPHPDESAHYADAGRYLSMVLDKRLYLMDDSSRNQQTQAIQEYHG